MSTNTEIVKAELPDPVVMMKDADSMITVVEAIEITDDDMYDLAGQELKRCKNRIKELTDQRMGVTRKLDDAKKSIMDLFRPAIERLEGGVKALNKGMTDYYNEQERKRKEEEARIAAERRAAEEKARKEAEAARKKAEKAKRPEVKAQAEAQAKIAEQTAENVATTAPAPATQKLKGGRKVWTFEVEDFSKLPDEYKVVNEQALRGMASSTKGKVQIPGVRFYQETKITSR